MSRGDIAIVVLLVLGVGGELVCCAGLVAARTAFDRLHYASAAAAVPPFLIAAAVLVEERWSQPGINALVVAILVFALNGALAHATARVARLHGERK